MAGALEEGRAARWNSQQRFHGFGRQGTLGDDMGIIKGRVQEYQRGRGLEAGKSFQRDRRRRAGFKGREC